jgi:hypothetical protein
VLPFLLPMLIGGGLGALTSKKDPLKGALMGAGLGAAGGAFAPGLFGSAAGASGASGAGLMGPTLPTGGVLPGLEQYAQGGLLGKLEPLGKAAGQVAQSGLLGGQEQPIQGQPVQQGQGGSQVLAQLAQQNDNIAQEADLRKKRRQGLLGVTA